MKESPHYIEPPTLEEKGSMVNEKFQANWQGEVNSRPEYYPYRYQSKGIISSKLLERFSHPPSKMFGEARIGMSSLKTYLSSVYNIHEPVDIDNSQIFWVAITKSCAGQEKIIKTGFGPVVIDTGDKYDDIESFKDQLKKMLIPYYLGVSLEFEIHIVDAKNIEPTPIVISSSEDEAESSGEVFKENKPTDDFQADVKYDVQCITDGNRESITKNDDENTDTIKNEDLTRNDDMDPNLNNGFNKPDSDDLSSKLQESKKGPESSNNAEDHNLDSTQHSIELAISKTEESKDLITNNNTSVVNTSIEDETISNAKTDDFDTNSIVENSNVTDVHTNNAFESEIPFATSAELSTGETMESNTDEPVLSEQLNTSNTQPTDQISDTTQSSTFTTPFVSLVPKKSTYLTEFYKGSSTNSTPKSTGITLEQKAQPTKRDFEKYLYKGKSNDACTSCKQSGRFICCDACPKVFHFLCAEPPLDEERAKSLDYWFCKECQYKRLGVKPVDVGESESLLKPLLVSLDGKNPKTFTVPEEIRRSIEVLKDSYCDEYPEDEEGVNIIRNPDALVDRYGRFIFCYACKKSALHGKIISCDYCDLSWHWDCLKPMLSLMPPPDLRWKCPNHGDSKNSLSRCFVKQHFVDLSNFSPNVANNGNIELVDDLTFDYEFLDPQKRFRIPISHIQDRFIHDISNRRHIKEVAHAIKNSGLSTRQWLESVIDFQNQVARFMAANRDEGSMSTDMTIAEVENDPYTLLAASAVKLLFPTSTTEVTPVSPLDEPASTTPTTSTPANPELTHQPAVDTSGIEDPLSKTVDTNSKESSEC
ncbi:hypothetical protein AX774_g2855 [Zancudomyces culisetae]|uniref:PHD-type domain-containing protein n=1 Tax=Zancudomyces culisetae TaxID=1213189 RepID=A0A1R1PRP5_ZANCU|nr:hypothetical protein AX774_g2855 [Zancudomyces culisetae]|eukprot:OMH83637.1 hypothetical protein AX774_g2855 [Zancudomyces culisetae]